MSAYRFLGMLLAATTLSQARITRMLSDHSGQNILVSTVLRVPGMPPAPANVSQPPLNFVRLQANGTPAGGVVGTSATATMLGFSPDGSSVLYSQSRTSGNVLVRQEISSTTAATRHEVGFSPLVSPNLKWCVDSSTLIDLESGASTPLGFVGILSVTDDGSLLMQDAGVKFRVWSRTRGFVELPNASTPFLSPDGTRVVYVRCAVADCSSTSTNREFETVTAPLADPLKTTRLSFPGNVTGFSRASSQWLSLKLSSGATGLVQIDGSGFRDLGKLNQDFLLFDISGNGEVLYVLKPDYSIDRYPLKEPNTRQRVIEPISVIDSVSIAPGNFAYVNGVGLQNESLRFELHTGGGNLRVTGRQIFAPPGLPYGKYTLRVEPSTGPFLTPEGNLTVRACALHQLPGGKSYEDGSREAYLSGIGPPEFVEHKLRALSVTGYWRNNRGFLVPVAGAADAEVKPGSEPGTFSVRWKWDYQGLVPVYGLSFAYGTECATLPSL